MNLREHVMEKVAAVEVTVPAGELLELLDERDALKDRVSSLEFRLGFGVSGPPNFNGGYVPPPVRGAATVETVECTCTDPPTAYEFTTIERADGSIEGGWDIQDGDEMVTVNVEPPVGDCSCKVPELSPRLQAYAEAIAPSTFERAVCGSRQPIGQVVETPAPVLKDKPFVKDKGAGKPSETVVPWSSKLTPNQTLLMVRMLSEGAKGVTVAANARCTPQQVGGVMGAYRQQIEALEATGGADAKEKFLDSLYRQMLARWQAAGKDPAVQPEAPVPTKTLSEAAKPDNPSKLKD